MKKRNNSSVRVRNLPGYGPYMEMDSPEWNRRFAFSTKFQVYKTPQRKVNGEQKTKPDIPNFERTAIEDKGSNPYAESIAYPELIKNYADLATYLLGNIFPSVGLGAIVADAGVGKSTLARQLALAIAYTEKEFLGLKVNAIHNNTIILATEDIKSDVAECMKDQEKGINKGYSPNGIKLLFEPKDPFKAIENELKTKEADLVIIDTFIHLLDGNVNSSNAVTEAFKKLRIIAEKNSCFILIIHHKSKAGSSASPSQHNSLGSASFSFNVRVQIDLIKDSDDPEIVHFCIVKGNKIPENEKRLTYKLKLGENRLFHNTGERVPVSDIGEKKKVQDEQPSSPKKTLQKRQGKLSNNVIKDIITKLKKGAKQTVLAQEFDVTQGAISQLWKKYHAGDLQID